MLAGIMYMEFGWVIYLVMAYVVSLPGLSFISSCKILSRDIGLGRCCPRCSSAQSCQMSI